MHFTLLTPQNTVFDGDIKDTVVPGIEGYIGFLEGHVPFVSPLKTGVLEINSNDKLSKYVVSGGGYLEVSSNGIIVLTENAEAVENIDPAQAKENLKLAEELLTKADENADINDLNAKLEEALVRAEAVESIH